MAVIPTSVLDRANTRVGVSDAQVLRNVVTRAQRLEGLGYRRIWVAEHHGVPGIAGSAPTLLMAAVAAATERIRVGSGGIMIPDHQPLVTAEHIATLSALFGDRLDFGLGKSVGFTAPVRRALRQDEDAAKARAGYVDDLHELLSYLRQGVEAGGRDQPIEGHPGLPAEGHPARPAKGRLDQRAEVTMRPQLSAPAQLHILAGGSSIDLAADLGLGLVLGGPSVWPLPEQARSGAGHEGIARYRERFQPSPGHPEPHVMVSLSVAVADTTDRARDLLLPESWAIAQSRSTGSFDALQPASALDLSTLTARQRRHLDESMAGTLYGTPGEVRQGIDALLDHTGADELLVTGGMHDPDGRARSDTLLAELLELG